ncbi:actin-crosslinking protein [Trichodelitschia bisporula]|uniref:Actin-crosslinking protein n=1 Tax=Trichodelitschia bisporula TaxID=703511 RepID=A0A6G1I162_9PEZI|nr:actin-crosslinking protein [Trichodelitschia bisporula]
MVKALMFKGEKKPKKRKRTQVDDDTEGQQLTKAAPSTSQTAAGDDDSWVGADAPSDITGPIIFVLPTDEPSCLSCDANGTVFAIPVENIVEADPGTAEPHDVRQVWIANRVAGTESLSFKSHHGRYLGCDKFGVLAATREAISPEESFLCIPVADSPGTFAVQTQREKFVTIDENGGEGNKVIRGDSENIDFRSTLRIRMQARFKPKLKVAKEERARGRISRKELEEMVGRKLDDADVKMLKKARREGDFHERLLDVKVKGKHDKYA